MADSSDVQQSHRYTRRTTFDAILVGGAIATFLFFVYELQSILSPLFLAVAIWLMLWPLRRARATRALLIALSFLLTLWLFTELRTVLLPFLAVYLLAYLFNPLVSILEERFRMPRWVSAGGVTLIVIGTIAFLLVLLIPAIVDQLQLLARDLPRSVTVIQQWLRENEFLAYLESMNLLNRSHLSNEIGNFLPRQIAAFAANIPRAIQGLYTSLGSVLAAITMALIMPVVLFYMLRDYPAIRQRMLEFLPLRADRREVLDTVGRVMGNYLRGQLTISAISAINVTFWLTLFDVPFALLIGLLSGILNMIPNIGVIITNVIGVILALLFGDPAWVKAGIVLLVLFGEQLLEATILTPNIMSHRVGLHPVLVILSLFIFGKFLNVLGLLIAVPATALLITFYQTYRGELVLSYDQTEETSHTA